jgi:hypothetical protein
LLIARAMSLVMYFGFHAAAVAAYTASNTHTSQLSNKQLAVKIAALKQQLMHAPDPTQG